MKLWRKKNLFGLFLALFFCLRPFLAFSAVSNSPSIEIVSFEKRPEWLRFILTFSGEFDFLLETPERIYLIAKPNDLTLLQANGILYRIETPFFPPAWSHSKEISFASGANGAYHSYSELVTDLKNLAQKFFSLSLLEELGKSLEGRSIFALKISDNVALNEAEPGIIFLGCHHAREWISVEVPFLLGRYLLEHYHDSPVIQKLVNEAQIWIVPLVNPDGLEYSIRYYRYWRKNRRLNSDGSYGVDLNRNYGFNWGIDNRGSSPNPSSETYRGTAPFSEPETRAVRDLLAKYKTHALISYHSYSQVILYPWGFTTAPADKSQLLLNLAQRMSDFMASVYGRRYAFGQASTLLYLTNGDLTDWAYGIAGIPAFTIELPPIDLLQGGFFNAEADIQPIFEENLVAALDLIKWCLDNYSLDQQLQLKSRKNLAREGKANLSPIIWTNRKN